jgi:hypothetical protein
VALCGRLLSRNTRGGTVVVGALNLGGSVELIPNAARIVELAIDKQAQTILMPVAGAPAVERSARRAVDEDQHRVLQGLGGCRVQSARGMRFALICQ